ncbi:hypothetical protein KIW84_010359 [Lathyrus oleraceus]|uniref:Late nodulin domain-containing protein n=1 Tax=Pisum sativum TaxID=3888 RepID=A0A9D4YJN6_PEA|nr:hypothetical protein KIW84_010359 [Pisum sativum]
MASILKLYVVFIFLFFFFVASNVDGRACTNDHQCRCTEHTISKCVSGFCRCYTYKKEMASILKLYVVFIFLFFFFVASNVDGRACTNDHQCRCTEHTISKCVSGFCRCYTYSDIYFKRMNKY